MKNLIRKRKGITVVDSIMGSGKTSWAIQYINQSSPSTKFIFITPYLTEIERIIEKTTKFLYSQARMESKINLLH